MKLNLYSIYDTVAEVFNKPYTEINDGSAIRAFTNSIQENPNKNDYALYCVAEMDDNSGEVISQNTPVKIFTGIDIKKAQLSSITPDQQMQDLKHMQNETS